MYNFISLLLFEARCVGQKKTGSRAGNCLQTMTHWQHPDARSCQSSKLRLKGLCLWQAVPADSAALPSKFRGSAHKRGTSKVEVLYLPYLGSSFFSFSC